MRRELQRVIIAGCCCQFLSAEFLQHYIFPIEFISRQYQQILPACYQGRIIKKIIFLGI